MVTRFSEEIKSIRRKSFLSQEAFAQALGVSFTTVHRWEAGKTAPSYKALKTIKNYCKENEIDFNAESFFIEEETLSNES